MKSNNRNSSVARCHHRDQDSAFKSSVELLKNAGLKLTLPRQTLLQAITQHDGPFSAEDIFASCKKLSRKSAGDLVTIYRSLATFSDISILTRCDFGDGTVRYELLEQDGSHHHHVICTSCKTVEPISFCVVEGQEQIIEQMGYSRLTHKLEFFGLCPSCSD
jgi:Fur family ferric uptake transcriptional regulator